MRVKDLSSRGGTDPRRGRPTSAVAADRALPLQAVIMPAALLLIALYFTVVSPGHAFLGPRNVSNLAIELAGTAVLALGMLLVILPGHIDLAAGSAVGLFGGIAAVLVFRYEWPAAAAMAASAVAAVLVYWAMGAMIVVQRVPAFIITLGGMLVFRGLHWLVIQNATIPVTRGGAENLYSSLTTYHLPPLAGYVVAGAVIALMAAGAFLGFRRQSRAGVVTDGEAVFLRTFVVAQVIVLLVVVCNGYQGVPLAVLILGAVAALTMGVTRHTPFGRYLYAIGGNEEAAVVSGVPVRAVTIAAFAAMGLLAALTGLMQTAYSGASTTTVGVNLELDAIAACVIGGTSLRGGRGTVGGVLMGALIMALLINGMTLMAYGPEAKYVLRGVVLAAAVWADVRLGKR
jgi:D-xylose transport system permease protein